MIDVFDLGGPHDKVSKWTRDFGDAATFRAGVKAASALWTGRPFVLSGAQAKLDVWFGSLDESSAKVLKDHAFFWILTDGGQYAHDWISADRVIVLDWDRQEQHIVRDALCWLERFPRLAGLSKSMQHLREEIERIAMGSTGPFAPVLILGGSGAGKEGVARSLAEVSRRPKVPGFDAITGAWLKMDPGLALSELLGIEGGVGTEIKERPGLVETYSSGTLLIDDFDTASVLVQENLLRLMSTEKGRKARYRRIGGEDWLETDVWLLFSTNADIEKMLSDGRMRMDFLFRFEDRVLVIPSLKKRPADLPAIAYRLWADLLSKSDPPINDRILPWTSLRNLHARDLKWEGNVRELAALLGLVVSMARMVKHRIHATEDLMDEVLSKGPGYKDWFIVMSDPFYTAAPEPSLPKCIRDTLSFDDGPSIGGLSPCEREIKSMLTDAHWDRLVAIIKKTFKGDSARMQLQKVFCRYLVHAHRHSTITIEDAQPLGDVKPAQARNHLIWLSDESTFLQLQKRDKSNSKTVYRLGTYFPSQNAAGIFENPV